MLHCCVDRHSISSWPNSESDLLTSKTESLPRNMNQWLGNRFPLCSLWEQVHSLQNIQWRSSGQQGTSWLSYGPTKFWLYFSFLDSPGPGGRSCKGASVEHMVCENSLCPKGSASFRDHQCQSHDRNSNKKKSPLTAIIIDGTCDPYFTDSSLLL